MKRLIYILLLLSFTSHAQIMCGEAGSIKPSINATTTTWDLSKCSSVITLSNGNLTATCSGAAGANGDKVLSVAGHSSGKYYWEVTDNTDANNTFIGFALSTSSVNIGPGLDANSWGYQGANGFKWNNSSPAGYGTPFGVGTVLCFAMDMTAGKIWVGHVVSGVCTWYGSGNPSTGANAMFTGLSGTMYAACGRGNNIIGQVWIANFGASSYAGGVSVPSGFGNL